MSIPAECLTPRGRVGEDEAKTRASLQDGLQVEQWTVALPASTTEAERRRAAGGS